MSSSSKAILGIETSCDETAAAVVVGGVTVRSNVIATQHSLHRRFGGVVPELAGRAHLERLIPVLREALAQAELGWPEIDAVAVGNRPGLIGSLLVGVGAAKALAWSLGRPLLGIDHVEAHLHAGLLESPPVEHPALGLVVSGGHTSLFLLEAPGHCLEIGRTIDDAIGEAYDKIGVLLDLPYPGGPHVDRLAGAGDPCAFDFPVSLPRRDSIDFSFSGLKTAVLYAVRPPAQRTARQGADADGAAPPRPLDERRRADIAASFQRAAIAVILRKLGIALDRHPVRTLLVGGGVSANSLLREELARVAEERGLALRLPRLEFCLDNAAMIAGAAHLRLQRGAIDDLHLSAEPRRRESPR